MVLRKDRPPCGVENSTKLSTAPVIVDTMANEQPVTKRQRIENGKLETDAVDTPLPNQISTTASEILLSSPSTSSSGISSTSNSSSNNNISDDSIQFDEPDELDNAGIITVPTLLIPASSNGHPHYLSENVQSAKASIQQQQQQNSVSDNDLVLFQSNLLRQCLCGVSERTLRRPFQSHYNHHGTSNGGSTTSGTSGGRRIATLAEWPTPSLIHFLSNLQLLFEVYLKQNKCGSICGRIKDVCDALTMNEHNLINEIIDLSDYNNKYVQYLAGRVMSSFLVIAQDSQYCNDWLKKLVDNLFIFEELNAAATQKITFSLEIFKRIIEWKDVDEHPLDDEIVEDDDGGDATPSLIPPPIENNYFYFAADYEQQPSTSSRDTHRDTRHNRTAAATSSSNTRGNISDNRESDDGCHLITDYECIDTTKLKCDTVNIIENKWPALLRNMNVLISSYGSRRNVDYGETLVLTFLELWKSIISVQANLSVNDTHPFHAQLDQFEEMHLNHNLPATVYKQMLTLFNEALCYGSTLSLQDIIPDETCNLAHRIIKHIKDDSPLGLLQSVPIRPTENPVSLIGYVGRSISDSMRSVYPPYDHDNRLHELHSLQHLSDFTAHGHHLFDKTFLQKMVLLVLKSVAVTVREMRSDSSDSSIDSNDYQAYSDLILIEQNMRSVLKKLDVFTKNKLQLHPEHHFSKMLVYLFDDQDDFLIEAMVCTLDVTAGFTMRTTAFTENPFGELIKLLNPVYTFLEFLNMTSKSSDLLLDLLVSNETCFLLYLLRFLKYISKDWYMFDESCKGFGLINGLRDVRDVREDVMIVLNALRNKISQMVASCTFPYDISPIQRLLDICDQLHSGTQL